MKQLIHESLNENGLPKKALTIIHKADRLIHHYDQLANKPEVIYFYGDDFRYLKDKLEKNGQEITNVAYRGYRIGNYEAPSE